MDLTRKEIGLCEQVAEKHIKKVKYGEWYLLNGKPILCAYANEGFHKSLEAENKIVPLWTISDCLEFLNERAFYLEGLSQADECEYECDISEMDDMGLVRHTKRHFEGKTLLEACLKAVLAVVVEVSNG